MSDGLLYDPGAEFAVLAGLLAYPQTREDVSRLIGPGDFAVEQHRDLMALLIELEDYDPQRIMTEATRRQLPAVVRLLPTLVGRQTVPGHVAVHAATVRGMSRRRRAIELGTRLVQQARTLERDEGETLVEAMSGLEGLIDTAATEDTPPPAIEDFLLGRDYEDWLVPGLLARPDRVMLTGKTGGGKSELTRQIAVCVAAGVHPFLYTEVEPRRVLLLDCENGRNLLRKRLRYVAEVAAARGRPIPKGYLRVISRPGGIDLGSTQDAAWLTRQVELARADLLVTGPLYRLHNSALNDEPEARQVTVALDRACGRVGAALVLEAHAGHSNDAQQTWRPKGSSLFMAWAHYGLGLTTTKRDPDRIVLYNWRGARDERRWPETLVRGGKETWPWVEDAPWGSTPA